MGDGLLELCSHDHCGRPACVILGVKTFGENGSGFAHAYSCDKEGHIDSLFKSIRIVTGELVADPVKALTEGQERYNKRFEDG